MSTRSGRVSVTWVLAAAVLALPAFSATAPQASAPAAPAATPPTTAEIMETFGKASTGNVADAVDEATGLRGFMSRDMKPVFKAKVIGPAVTVLLRRALRSDRRDWPNPQTQTLEIR